MFKLFIMMQSLCTSIDDIALKNTHARAHKHTHRYIEHICDTHFYLHIGEKKTYGKMNDMAILLPDSK